MDPSSMAYSICRTLCRLNSSMIQMKHKTWLSPFLKIFVTLFSLFLLSRLLDWPKVFALSQQANYVYLSAAFFIFILANVFGSVSWHFVMRSKYNDIPFRDTCSTYWTGLFFNSFLPSNIGGDIAKAYKIVKRHHRTSFFIASILLDRIMNLSVLISFGILGFYFTFESFRFPVLICVLFGIGVVILLTQTKTIPSKTLYIAFT